MTIDWSQISGLVVAIGTAALAIYAGLNFKGLKDQMKLLLEQAASMKRQADAMEGQTKFIRDQSDAMTRQAKTMEGQSNLMRANIEYDQLVRKYERLNRAMNKLVGPLFSKKDDYVIFISGMNISPVPKEYKDFWEYITKNIYLADKDLYSELHSYFMAVKMYIKSGTDGYGRHPQEATDLFIAEKDKLLKRIELSYKNLKEEMIKTGPCMSIVDWIYIS
jgi:hypothetical protein